MVFGNCLLSVFCHANVNNGEPLSVHHIAYAEKAANPQLLNKVARCIT